MTFNCVSLWNINWTSISQISTSSNIPPIWRIILLGDGSFTRHSQILTYSTSVINHICTHIYIKNNIHSSSYVNRKIWIGTNKRKNLIFASSWWNLIEYEKVYKDPSKAIGSFLIQSELDFYRDIHGIFLGYSLELELIFASTGPFWGRYYTLFHKGQPVSIIYEIFSPILENF